jgi:hypothetical protein
MWRRGFYQVPFGDSLSYVASAVEVRDEIIRGSSKFWSVGIYNIILAKFVGRSIKGYRIVSFLQLLVTSYLLYKSISMYNFLYSLPFILFFYIFLLTRQGIQLLTPGPRWFGYTLSWLMCLALLSLNNNTFCEILFICSFILLFYTGKFWRQLLVYWLLILIFCSLKLFFICFSLIIFLLVFSSSARRSVTDQISFVINEIKVQNSFGLKLLKFSKRDLALLLTWIGPIVLLGWSFYKFSGDYMGSYIISLVVVMIFFPPFKMIGVAERYIFAIMPFWSVGEIGSYLVIPSIFSYAIFIFRHGIMGKMSDIKKFKALLQKIKNKKIACQFLRFNDLIFLLSPDLPIHRVQIGRYVEAQNSGEMSYSKKIFSHNFCDDTIFLESSSFDEIQLELLEKLKNDL